VLPDLHGGLRGVPHVTFARQVPYWAYYANFIMAIGDWGASTRHTPHFWTLAVEEQFYLVWPALVLWAGTRRMIPLSLSFIAGALALRTGLVLAGAIPTMATLATPCRVDALAIGALIATIVRRPDLVPRVRLAFPGFAVCFAAVLGLIAWRGNLAESDPIIRTVGISLVGLMFGMLVTVAIQVQPGTLIYRCFTFAPLRLAGRYSYGIYVIHYPVMILLGDYGWSYPGLAARYGSPAVAEALLVIVNTAVTFALAVASFHLLEKPFLSLKRYFSYAREVAPSIDVDLTASPEPAA
jgi:peptidoglycan/LPS O-acetylase OafA/YrhL